MLIGKPSPLGALSATPPIRLQRVANTLGVLGQDTGHLKLHVQHPDLQLCV